MTQAPREFSGVFVCIDDHADASIAELQRLLRKPSTVAQNHGMIETAAMAEVLRVVIERNLGRLKWRAFRSSVVSS